jgi:putative aldouronate transport system permease protein
MKQYRSDLPFQILNATVLIVLALTMIAPMIHLLAVSLSNAKFAAAKVVGLWPRGFNTAVYERVFQTASLWRAMAITVYITVAGTLVSLVLSSSLAYALSRPGMKGRKFVTQGVLLTFIFSAPLIPAYLVVRALGLENHLMALILPGALGAYYVLIMKTFYQGISSELFDAAKIDGAGEFGTYVRIVVPLSTAVTATIALFHAVGQWNSYFSALIFIRNKRLHPLQIVLRDLVVGELSGSLTAYDLDIQVMTTPEQIRAGIILFATLPILIVYPFLQKYFVKGAMLGSVKG